MGCSPPPPPPDRSLASFQGNTLNAWALIAHSRQMPAEPPQGTSHPLWGLRAGYGGACPLEGSCLLALGGAWKLLVAAPSGCAAVTAAGTPLRAQSGALDSGGGGGGLCSQLGTQDSAVGRQCPHPEHS